MYCADQPQHSTSAGYGGGLSYCSATGGHRPTEPVDSCCSPLQGEVGRRQRGGGHLAGDERSSRGADNGRCMAWILAGQLNADSDVSRSSCSDDQRCGVAAAERRICQAMPSASPSEDLESRPVFDVDFCDSPATPPASHVCRNHLTMATSHPAFRSLDVDQHYPSAARRTSRTPEQQWNYVKPNRHCDGSSPKLLIVSSLYDLRPRNDYDSSSYVPGKSHRRACARVQNGHTNGGSDAAFEGRRNSGLGCGVSPAEFEASTKTKSPFSGLSLASSSPNVAAAVSPRLEAHTLSLSCASVYHVNSSKTQQAAQRSMSTSSSSSSLSSTPNIIRRRFKAIAHTLDTGLAALGASRHELATNSNRKLAITRSSSEPEALDRVTQDRRSTGDDDDEFGFNCSCPSYRVRALRHQQDDEPPCPSSFVGRSSTDCGGAVGSVRASVDEAVTPSPFNCAGKSASTSKAGRRLTSMLTAGWSLMHKEHALPKVCCVLTTGYLSKCIGHNGTGAVDHVITVSSEACMVCSVYVFMYVGVMWDKL